jgi:hypothetical protein
MEEQKKLRVYNLKFSPLQPILSLPVRRTPELLSQLQPHQIKS